MMSPTTSNRMGIPICLGLTGTVMLATYSIYNTIDYHNKFITCYDRVAGEILKNPQSDLINLNETERYTAIDKIAKNTCVRHWGHYEASVKISLGFFFIASVTAIAAGIILGRSLSTRRRDPNKIV